MKSIPAALTWELIERGRWSLPAAALGSLAFPLLVLSSLAQVGALDPRDGNTLIMHFVMVQMNACAFGAPLLVSTWRLSPLYAYPASAATLVTWRLLPMMVLMTIETVVWTAALNALFPLDWPLWGPALLSAVTLAVATATLWLTHQSRWVIVAISVVAAPLGLWFKARYGPMFSDPTHLWDTVTPGEILALLAAAVFAFWIGTIATARNRRGEPPFSLGIAAWFERLFDRAPAARRPFGSPQRAQLWYVWRNGWLAPVIVAGVLFVGFIIWLFASRNPQELAESLVAAGMVVVLAGFVNSAVMGNVGAGGDLVMNQFQATRPLTTADYARTILCGAAASLLLAWAIWVAAVAAVYAGFMAFGVELSPLTSQTTAWPLVPVFLLGSWIVMGGFISICLTGRSRPFFRIFIALMAAYIGGILLAQFVLSHDVVDIVMRALTLVFGVGFALGTIWAFVVARRRGLVDAATAWAAFGAWSALVIAAVLMLPPTFGTQGGSYTLLIGILALAVAPLAAAPLALAWNRHR